MKIETTRRAMLSCAPALAATISSLPAVAAPLGPDPIFAALEAKRAAWATVEAACEGDCDDAIKAAFAADAVMLRRVAATAPTTLAGVGAFIQFMRAEIFECERGSPCDVTLAPLALGTLSLAVAGLGSPAPTPKSPGADGELVRLGAELHAAGAAIDANNDLGEEDIDRLIDRYEHVWTTMCALPATTIHGLLAKAQYGLRGRAMNRVAEDAFVDDAHACGDVLLDDLALIAQRVVAAGVA